MSYNLTAIIEATQDLLNAIDRRSVGDVRHIGAIAMRYLPPVDPDDGFMSLPLCMTAVELQYAHILVMLPRSIQRWLKWTDEPTAEWPEPSRLRECVAVLRATENLSSQ